MSGEVLAALADAHRTDWARILATTARVTGDLGLAEECTQDAYARALETWSQSGVPSRPAAWLTQVARNRALDIVRRDSVWRRSLPQLVQSASVPGPEDGLDDDRLRLIFTCCHPALAREAQVALTLRLVCGMSTVEVARAFLVQESTMAARITRAKKKIAVAAIPYRVPTPDHLPERVGAVLEVVHLIFTTGHTAPVGTQLVRHDLVDNAIGLARLLRTLMPNDPDAAALLALFLVNDARRATRVGPEGRLRVLSEQDRSQWDRAAIAEGTRLLSAALRSGPPSRYALEAAVAAVHAEAPTWEATDWGEIVDLYDVMLRRFPSAVVALNRAVAVGLRDGPRAGLEALRPLMDEPALATYGGYLSAARAHFLLSLGSHRKALEAYEEALALTDNEAERRFLAGRLEEARHGPTTAQDR
ncbi:RNA polymerase sigma factor [Nocardioides sp. zg-1228]|uniref:RNA polymerase sigma factor n=1 Tax=Nocardioides sp. zg-1228 TaxID=2763008 RepID=UPI001642D9B4|nr:sigma-70 family RNA polymerase sigma factor [Nocardioides sp. zg-1228]MBC2933033.1 sigma-70 family RNA polymerase sigma factor [Nocardioides sp. zg-1228]QSF56773.1 sigma-70 family RNA polymerase sigma factor [Nocardioides sp. zg-1228]